MPSDPFVKFPVPLVNGMTLISDISNANAANLVLKLRLAHFRDRVCKWIVSRGKSKPEMKRASKADNMSRAGSDIQLRFIE